MSGAGKTFGTQSPPLESTGQEQPMGVSSINGDKPQGVPDSKQRQQYFDEGIQASEQTSEAKGTQTEKLKTD